MCGRINGYQICKALHEGEFVRKDLKSLFGHESPTPDLSARPHKLLYWEEMRLKILNSAIQHSAVTQK
jgi:hypothetical protein